MNESIPAFPKIFAIGSRNVLDIFDGPVEITEKIDGSQFGFGKINGELIARSKNKFIDLDAPEKMFRLGVEYIQSIEYLPENIGFYGEFLNKPKHNSLSYDRVPRNNIILFGAMNTVGDETESFKQGRNFDIYCKDLDLEVVPIIYSGMVKDVNMLSELLDRESILGGTKIEGIVVKNYNKHVEYFGGPIPIMCGKYVSEVFKERNAHVWNLKSNKGSFEVFKESFRTEARWLKAIQCLRDNGELMDDPKDIGSLIKRIQMDITEECEDDIRDFLWKTYGKTITSHAIKGFPEFYKKHLVEMSFEEGI